MASRSPDADASGTTQRPAARDILHAAREVGEDELKRSPVGLGFSALAAGSTLGLTGLSVALVLSVTAGLAGAELIAALFYPLGFIAVIVGRQQLFTENTLFPVILVLEERRHLRATARLWVVVLLANQVGAAFFAFIAAKTSALPEDVQARLVELGEHAAAPGASELFWSGLVGGWIIALMAWMVTGAQWTIAQVVIIWIMTLPLGLGEFAHSVAGAGEILTAAWDGALGPGDYFSWLWAAVLGNVVGGVVLVTLLNYAQVVGSGRDRERSNLSVDEAHADMRRERPARNPFGRRSS